MNQQKTKKVKSRTQYRIFNKFPKGIIQYRNTIKPKEFKSITDKDLKLNSIISFQIPLIQYLHLLQIRKREELLYLFIIHHYRIKKQKDYITKQKLINALKKDFDLEFNLKVLANLKKYKMIKIDKLKSGEERITPSTSTFLRNFVFDKWTGLKIFFKDLKKDSEITPFSFLEVYYENLLIFLKNMQKLHKITPKTSLNYFFYLSIITFLDKYQVTRKQLQAISGFAPTTQKEYEKAMKIQKTYIFQHKQEYVVPDNIEQKANIYYHHRDEQIKKILKIKNNRKKLKHLENKILRKVDHRKRNSGDEKSPQAHLRGKLGDNLSGLVSLAELYLSEEINYFTRVFNIYKFKNFINTGLLNYYLFKKGVFDKNTLLNLFPLNNL